MQIKVVKIDGCKGVREPRTETQETEYRQPGRDLVALLKRKEYDMLWQLI